MEVEQSAMRAALLLLSLAAVSTMSEDRTRPLQPSCPSGCRCAGDVASRTWTTVDCSGLNLTALPAVDADHVTDVESLSASDNRLGHLDLSLLRAFPNLRSFEARNGSVRSLTKSSRDYQPLRELSRMDLSGNHLHVIHPFVFSGFPSLKALNLSGNAIHTVAATAFALPALESLDLSRNRLEEILPHFFDSSPKIGEIDLSGNRLSRLNDGTFGLITSLDVLDLSHNSLMRVEENVLVGMSVGHLDLGFNAFRRLPNAALRKLTASKTVVLDGNLMSVLEAGALHDVPVEFLSISRNAHLTRVDENALRSLPNLQTLTVNNNPRLAYVHSGAIADVPRLAALDLSRNGLYALESSMLSSLRPSLKALYLDGNRFHCHCSLAWISEPSSASVLPDRDRILCRPGATNGGSADTDSAADAAVSVSVVEMGSRFDPECEPYILPLFPALSEVMMGRSVSWLCKALGSDDIAVYWRLPSQQQQQQQQTQQPASTSHWAQLRSATSMSSLLVRDGDCDGRVCMEENVLTVNYLHPADVGRYTCVAQNKYGRDQKHVNLDVKSEHIQIFPITVASTFVTLSWNSSSALSTGRGYILQVTRQHSDGERRAVGGGGNDVAASASDLLPRQFEDIDVGLKMNSYTVNGLSPGRTYLFELCLRKERYVITISSTVLTTKYSGFEVELGIETDYVSLFSVAIILTSMVTVCFTVSLFRVWHYYYYYYNRTGVVGRKDPDAMSQREMIVSPSEHSSVNCVAASGAGVGVNNGGVVNAAAVASSSSGGSSVVAETGSGLNFSTSGDESRLVEHEVRSPVEEVIRETVT